MHRLDFCADKLHSQLAASKIHATIKKRGIEQCTRHSQFGTSGFNKYN